MIKTKRDATEGKELSNQERIEIFEDKRKIQTPWNF